MRLPEILSGPILRKVTQNEIYIWVATSYPYKIKANLYEVSASATNKPFDYELISKQSTVTSIQMGQNLFIHLIKIEPETASFPTQTLLGYNLYFRTKSKMIDLGDLGLLSTNNPNSIVYGGLNYPTFYINEDQGTAKLYGSCRKLHGDGKDALAKGDEALWESYLNIKNRPSALFLVGDQIYADDVPDPVVPHLFYLANKLIGDEATTLSELDDRLKENKYKSNLYKVHGRKTIMDDLCHFTSSKSHNHLITLGEYAAMYVLSWSPEVWEVIEMNTFENLVLNDKYFMQALISNDTDGIETYSQTRQELNYLEEQQQLTSFKQTLPQVRRLLANIPTYMIFDDHDITDDWNISLEWKENVWNAPLGKHVIANGLAAYWAFQGWGNNPSGYNNAFLTTMAKHFSSLKYKGKAYEKWVELLWEFKNWAYIAPTKPTAVFLDTRTQRAYVAIDKQLRKKARIKQKIEGPELVSKAAWQQLTALLKESEWKPNSPLIIASPVPFYGIDLIETFIYHYVSPLKLLGIPVKTLFDIEAWKYNGRGFTQFLQTVSEWSPETCIIISGDAHSASSAISHLHQQDGNELTFVQFTSSPLKNPTFSGLIGFLLKGAVWLFQKKMKTSYIYRSCNDNYSLYQSTNKNSPSNTQTIWTEEIRYLSQENGNLIKTSNNLGYLSFQHEKKLINLFLS